MRDVVSFALSVVNGLLVIRVTYLIDSMTSESITRTVGYRYVTSFRGWMRKKTRTGKKG